MRGWGAGLSLLAVALAGCNSTAANKVLGDKAIVVDPAGKQQLTAPGVYRVMGDGTYVAYCKKDFEQNAALKAIAAAAETSADTVVDQVAAESVTVGFPGLPTLSLPYGKTKVEGYTVTRAAAPADGPFFDYVRANVADQCRGYLDSGQYVVVEQEARAKKSYKLLKGPVSGNLVLGPATIGGLGQEVSVTGPANATFGVVGAKAAR